ncbi:MAG: ubiquinone biosynthesis protein UbiA [Flavobacteriaceae bacterium]|nr:ubiquinone biosynthesis protein UbiA [Flavobacteriaceae bacterium]
MKSTIFKFFSLFSVIRIYNILVVILAQYLTAIFILDDQESFSSTLLDPYLFVIILCSSISIASGYIINNFYDYEKDIINRPIRSNIDRSIRKRTKLNLYFSLNLLCIILSLFISIRAVIFFLIYNIILWLYSHKLKKILILGNVLSSLLTITPFFAIFLYYKNFSKIIAVYALFLFFIILAKDLVKDLENLKGDFTLNYKTIAVVYGEKFSKIAINTIIIINYIIVISLILYFDIGLMFYYYYLCLLVLTFVLFFIWRSNDKRDYLFIHNIMRALIISGIFSIILI